MYPAVLHTERQGASGGKNIAKEVYSLSLRQINEATDADVCWI